MVMIKDNHIAAAGGIPQAVAGAEAFMRGKGIRRPLEVETRTLEELREVRVWAPGGGGCSLRVAMAGVLAGRCPAQAPRARNPPRHAAAPLPPTRLPPAPARCWRCWTARATLAAWSRG